MSPLRSTPARRICEASVASLMGSCMIGRRVLGGRVHPRTRLPGWQCEPERIAASHGPRTYAPRRRHRPAFSGNRSQRYIHRYIGAGHSRPGSTLLQSAAKRPDLPAKTANVTPASCKRAAHKRRLSQRPAQPWQDASPPPLYPATAALHCCRAAACLALQGFHRRFIEMLAIALGQRRATAHTPAARRLQHAATTAIGQQFIADALHAIPAQHLGRRQAGR